MNGKAFTILLAAGFALSTAGFPLMARGPDNRGGGERFSRGGPSSGSARADIVQVKQGGSGGGRGGGGGIRSGGGGGGRSFRGGGDFRGGGRSFRGGGGESRGGGRSFRGGGEFRSGRGRGGDGDFRIGRGRGGGEFRIRDRDFGREFRLRDRDFGREFRFRDRDFRDFRFRDRDFDRGRRFFRDRDFDDKRFFKHRFFRDDFRHRRFFDDDRFFRHDRFFKHRHFHHQPFFFKHRFFHGDPFFFRHRFLNDDIFFDDIVFPRRFCRANEFFFFVNLGSYLDRGVPTYVYETQQRYEKTPVDVAESDDPLARAYSAFAKGSYRQSIVEFGKALAAHPDDGLIYLARAQAFIATGDYAAAHGDIREGMRMIPDWPDVAINMEKLYSTPKAFAANLDRLQTWVDERPDDATARFVLGYVYYFTQDYERAKAELVRTLSAEPGHREADLLLKAIYEREAAAAQKKATPKEKSIEKKATGEKGAEKPIVEKSAVEEQV